MLTNYISLYLNGQPLNCAPNLSLKSFLSYMGFDINSVIVEYNGKIIHMAIFDTVFIVSGDRIEVLTIVGGG